MNNNNLKMLFLCLTFILGGMFAYADGSLKSISGIAKDRSTKKKLENVSISIPGTNIATVTNEDGNFLIKLPDNIEMPSLKADLIGYSTSYLSAEEIAKSDKEITIMLSPLSNTLKEVTVYGGQPRPLIENAMEKIPQNYSDSSSLFTAFYRETIQKGKRFIGISEAMTKIYKKSYKTRTIDSDRVKVIKGRKLLSQKSSDTLAVKILGGPTLPVILDVVKNENALFNKNELDYYDFKMEKIAFVDDRPQYVIEFSPKKVILPYPLSKGTVMIDCESLAFTRADFEMDMSDKNKATSSILRKKPAGLKFKPQEASYIVTYKLQDGKSYLNYISSKTRFKCDWKRRLFSSGYTARAEMVMVDRQDNSNEKISRKEVVKRNYILDDTVESFNDPDFWKDYNIIEPTESLDKAVYKLKKQ